MNCQDFEQRAMEYVLGTLDSDQQQAMNAHLAGNCPRCAGALAEAEAVVAQIAGDEIRQTPSTALRDKVMARVHSAPTENHAEPMPIARESRATWGWTVGTALLAAAVAAAITAGILMTRLGDVRTRLNATQTQLASTRAQADSRLAQLKAKDAALAASAAQLNQVRVRLAKVMQDVKMMHARNLKVVSLNGMGPSPQARAHLFWDQDTHAWYLYATGLPPTGHARTYELWLITGSKKKIPAGTFQVDAQGNGAMRIKMPSHKGKPMLAAVTEEPAGGMPHPTGAVRLMGHLE